MLLGALVDLGLPLDALRGELSKLPLKGYRIDAHKVHRSGLHATKVDVVTEESGHAHGHENRRYFSDCGFVGWLRFPVCSMASELER